MKKKYLQQRFIKTAFTLLEILVVVGIISTLVGFGALSYSTAQRKGRDAKRQSDLKIAQQTMEQCYSVNNFLYPVITNSAGTLTGTCPAPNASITFSIKDPLNSGTYVYVITTSTTSSFTLTSDLETSTTNFVVNSQQ